MDPPDDHAVVSVTREELFQEAKKVGLTSTSISRLMDLLKAFVLRNIPAAIISEDGEKKLYALIMMFRQKWKECHRCEERLRKLHGDWLCKVVFPLSEDPSLNTHPSTSRASKDFESCSIKVQQRKVHDLVTSHSSSQLGVAYTTALWKEGERSKSQVVKAISATPEKVVDLKNVVLGRKNEEPVPLLPSEALAFMIKNNFTKSQYVNTRKESKLRKADIFPPYNYVLEEKKKCMPGNDAIKITEISGEISLQALLDITTNRLLEAEWTKYESSLINHRTDNPHTLHFLWKYGFDGSSNQSEYNQKFSEEFKDSSDKNLFVICAVPLILRAANGQPGGIFWQNPKPASPQYCRPIKFIFKKEEDDFVLDQLASLESEIANLVPTKVIKDGVNIEVSYTLKLTMLDTKMCNCLSGTKSASTCYLCGILPSKANDLKLAFSKTPRTDLYCLGLSTLHAWIKIFELLLHIAYRLKLKKWRIIIPAEKVIKNEEKKRIQREFKEIGLIVDQPKQGGGNSNCGNTARRFFKNPPVSSKITQIVPGLIHRFHLILAVLASGYAIKYDVFKEYSKETAEFYVEIYPWYPMSPTAHKVLIHGAEIVKSMELPIGQYTEEALEAQNKVYRLFRKCFSRKRSREATNIDILCRMMCSSDPVILKSHVIKKATKLPRAALDLLEPNPCFDHLKLEEDKEEDEEEKVEEEGKSDDDEDEEMDEDIDEEIDEWIDEEMDEESDENMDMED
ncbi:unnamed protein product [Bemisia tabaci]|uniref:Uncharacterized protein n=1 Tax=Bemisia tabaci TaxID=7038 RepID=A0A9P0A026_BEMTA|nr:unnamed protein product [Bemisia tabaci]